MLRTWSWSGVWMSWLVGLLASPCAAQKPASKAWFESGSIPELRLTLDRAARAELRRAPRKYVQARLREGAGERFAVGIKLKGSAGSFQSLRDKPGLTIDVNRFDRDREFHGLVKFHLNNSVQDETYLQEFIAYEAFRLSGLPAPMVTHARVWLDDRDLGLYVLKEGYDRRFLRRCFGDDDGNLYDGGVNGEVRDDLDRDVGSGPLDRKDLHDLAAACALSPGEARRRAIAARLDIDRFLTFMCAEVMVGHWDGYTLNPNNYRVYFPRRTGKAVFLVHGADQVFQNPTAGLFQRGRGLVAAKVLEEPVWRRAYRQRIRELLTVFAPPTLLVDRVRKKAARLLPTVERTMSARFARRLVERQAGLRERIIERSKFLVKASRGGWPEVIDVPPEGVALGDRLWRKQSDCGDVVLQGDDAKSEALTIRAGRCKNCVGSWRTTVLLNPGRYEFAAVMTTEEVVVGSDDYNPGAGIRISGKQRSFVVEGSLDGSSQKFAFDVTRPGESVVLVVELRAASGSVAFPKKSLRLRKR